MIDKLETEKLKFLTLASIMMEELILVLKQQRVETWVTVSEVARMNGLTSDAIRKQLKSGKFEEGIDFKYEDNKIYIYQEAIMRIRRQRRIQNG